METRGNAEIPKSKLSIIQYSEMVGGMIAALYAVFAILGGFVLLGLIFWWCAKRAPFGWQDQYGWHPGEPPKDEESE